MEEYEGWDSGNDRRTSNRRLRSGLSAGNEVATRRSTRHTNGKRKSAELEGRPEWRGERRSARLGSLPDAQEEEYPVKRAKTEESSDADPASVHGDVSTSSHPEKGNHMRLKATGAAALKPTEMAVEAVEGKKKGKYWFYAIEPINGMANGEEQDTPPTSRLRHKNGIKRIESTEPSDSQPATEGEQSSKPMSLDSHSDAE